MAVRRGGLALVRRVPWLLTCALVEACAGNPVATVADGGSVGLPTWDAPCIDGDGTDAGMDGTAVTDVPVDTVGDVPAVSDVSFPMDPLAWSVHVPGPFHSGYRHFPLTYTPPGMGVSRATTVHVWYPTTATTGDHPRYFNLFTDPGAIVDAPLAPSVHPRGYPVLVYSHGSRGFGGTSYFLSDFFASHGWVVVAPDHTGNLLSDPGDPPFQIYYYRSTDISAALDAIEHLPATDPLAGHCDTTRVMLTGHSFGTHTVWSSSGGTFDTAMIRANCQPSGRCTDADLAVLAHGLRDPRVVAASPLAGSIDRSFFGPTGHTSVHIPLLAMSGTDNPVGDDVQYATTTPAVDLTWLDITGGCHQFFALGACDHIPDSLQVPIVGAYSLAFARKYVLGDTSRDVASMLDGTQSVSPLVTFHHR